MRWKLWTVAKEPRATGGFIAAEESIPSPWLEHRHVVSFSPYTAGAGGPTTGAIALTENWRCSL